MALKERVMRPMKPGQKPIHFMEGGLHQTTGTPMGEKIPGAKMKAAMAGRYGAKGAKQARFAKNVLTGSK